MAEPVYIPLSPALAGRIHALARAIVDHHLIEPMPVHDPNAAGLTIEVFVENAVRAALQQHERALAQYDHRLAL